MEKTKFCPYCGLDRPHAEFGPANKGKHKLQAYCRPCYRFYHVEHAYGISRVSYQEMLDRSKGRCDSCGDEFTSTPHVDHDHKCCPSGDRACGKCVRGLLCSTCNHVLGFVEKQGARIQQTTRYLERFD